MKSDAVDVLDRRGSTTGSPAGAECRETHRRLGEGEQIGPYLNKYAGEQMVNGGQAQAYADHFIAVHLRGVADGQTYAEVSAKAQQNPDDQTIQGQAATLFRGETLRGLFLNAYAFWKLGQLALIGAIAAFALAAVMLVLSILGFWHLRRASPSEQVIAPGSAASGERVSG
jgi:hypothetical protein